MKKFLLTGLLLVFFLSNAYSQKLGKSTSVGRGAGALVATVFFTGGFGIGQFINEDPLGGAVFLSLDVGIFTALSVTTFFVFSELLSADFRMKSLYSSENKRIRNYAIATTVLFWSFVGLWGIQFIFSAIHLGYVVGLDQDQKKMRQTLGDLQKAKYYASKVKYIKKVTDVLSFDAGGRLGLSLTKAF